MLPSKVLKCDPPQLVHIPGHGFLVQSHLPDRQVLRSSANIDRASEIWKQEMRKRCRPFKRAGKADAKNIWPAGKKRRISESRVEKLKEKKIWRRKRSVFFPWVLPSVTILRDAVVLGVALATVVARTLARLDTLFAAGVEHCSRHV